jgi:hypothetical protein
MTGVSDEALMRSVERGLSLSREAASVLAVLGTNASALDNWGRAFARRARREPGLNLEIYMPSTRDALIERFNQVLAGLSVEQARAERPPGSASRIILAPDIRSLDTPEGLLLARLASDFPGAATRLVVLVDRDGSVRTERLLQSLGRGITRFELDLEGEANTQPTTLATTVSAPSGGDAEHAPSFPGWSPVSSSETGAIDLLPEPLVQAAPSRRNGARWLGAGALLMAILLISALIVVLLHRERGPGAAFTQRLALEVPTSHWSAASPVRVPKRPVFDPPIAGA